MKYYSSSSHVQASQAAAWVFITDLHRRSEWEHGVRTLLSVDEGPVGVNTAFKERLRIFSLFHAEGEWRIAQFNACSLYEYRGRLPIIGSATFRYTLDPSDDGCVCTVQVYYEPRSGIAGTLLDKVFVGPRIARTIARNLRRMKRLVEARPTEA